MGEAVDQDPRAVEPGQRLGRLAPGAGGDRREARRNAVAAAHLRHTPQRRRGGAGVVVAQPQIDRAAGRRPGVDLDLEIVPAGHGDRRRRAAQAW
ncbi:MAG: hypothetical protein J4F33_12770, partial [Alphaproteobacteria bacterium]|nr:hypothetical protein [Alphaproteobacteria bacterium]